MKNIAMLAVMLNLGVASIHAQSTNLTVSGSAAASTVSLLGTRASEYQLAGNGAPGPITLRVLSTSMSAPQLSTSCSGATKVYFPNVGGAGVFSQDGDLLNLSLTGGGDCIDFAAGEALCTRIFQVIGGTGRFAKSSGTVTLIMKVAPVLADSGNPVFFSVTGTVSGVPRGQGSQGAQP